MKHFFHQWKKKPVRPDFEDLKRRIAALETEASVSSEALWLEETEERIIEEGRGERTHPDSEELCGYADGMLRRKDFARWQRVKRHVQECPDCRDDVTEIRSVVPLLWTYVESPLTSLLSWLGENLSWLVATPVRLAVSVLFLLFLTGAGLVTTQFMTLLSQFNTLVKQLHFDEPFTVHLSVVGQRSLQLDLRLHSEVVREAYVDWGDPNAPDPVGGTRIDPTQGIEIGEDRRLLSLTHSYGQVPREGLRRTVEVRIVPTALPEVRPETLTEEKLHRKRRIWILPYSIGLDPPEAKLTIVSPKAGEIITPTTKVQIRAGALTADIHLLALDPTTVNSTYWHLGKIPPPPLGQEATFTRIIDTSQLGTSGPFQLALVSTDQLEVATDGTVAWRAVPQTVPRDEVEVRHAGVLLVPTQGAVVSGGGTVHAKVFLPNTYVAAAIIPEKEGSCWIQNDGYRVLSPSAEFRTEVNYGGRDRYQVFVGITYDPDLFKDGDRLEQCPQKDSQGRPLYWLGPVDVTHD